MSEEDIPALEDIESIIVRGKASLPSSAVKTFRSKGKAGNYSVFEGKLVEINGFEQFSHGQLAASVNNGKKITLQVNGCLLFDDDVSAEDIECIAFISYNGSVIISGPARSALAQKVKTGNGFMGDSNMLEAMAGKTIGDIFGKSMKNPNDENTEESSINIGSYILA